GIEKTPNKPCKVNCPGDNSSLAAHFRATVPTLKRCEPGRARRSRMQANSMAGKKPKPNDVPKPAPDATRKLKPAAAPPKHELTEKEASELRNYSTARLRGRGDDDRP